MQAVPSVEEIITSSLFRNLGQEMCLEFPTFRIYKINMFSSYPHMLPQDSVNLASFHIEGRTPVWFSILGPQGVRSDH